MHTRALISFLKCRIVTEALLVSLLAGVVLSQAQHKAIHGLVKDAKSGERLPNVALVVRGTRIGSTSNLEGYFLVMNVPDSSFVLEARMVGYAVAQVRIDPEQEDGGISIQLTPKDVLLEGLTVSADEATFLKTQNQTSLTTISPRQMTTLPNIGQVDIFRSLQLLPGINGTNDRSSGLYVRGGTPDQNLVIFDGMTVYHVDHFFGFFSAFNPDAVKDVQLYKGGFPAEYGGRLSSVIDMKGKAGDPDNYHVSAGLNLLSANALVEVPLFNRGSFLIAARRSYSDIIASGTYSSLFNFLTGSSSSQTPQGFGSRNRGGGFRSFSTQQTPAMTFDDVNAKLTYDLTPQDILSASFYSSLDNLDQSQQSSTQTIRGTTTQVTIPPTTDQTKQGNLGASAKWFHQWSDRFYSNALFATAKYSSLYHYEIDRTNPNGNIQSRQSTNEDNSINDNTFRLDNQWIVNKEHDLSFGTEISHTNVAYTLSGTTVFNTTQANLLNIGEQSTQSAFYLQDTWNAVSPLDVTVGVRATDYTLTKQFFVEPRVSMRYALTENLALKGAYGKYHQFVNRIINEDLTQGSRDFWVVANNNLQPGSAEHYIAGGTLENEEYAFDVEAYYKKLGNLVEFSQRFRRTADDVYSFFSGSGTAKGIEVLLQKKQGTINGWISYTLGRAESVFPELNSGNPFPAEQDQTHELKIIGNIALGENWTASSTFTFGSGEPYTAPISQYSIVLLDSTKFQYTHISDKDAFRLPTYQRLDVSVSKRFGDETSSHWIVGLSAFNLLNHTNVEYYQYDLTSDPVHVTTVTGLGFTPTLFVQVDFQ